MSDLQQEIGRAVRAERLLSDELLIEAFATLEKQYIEAWIGSPARDSEGRERIFSHIQNLRKVRDHLQGVVNNGKLAQAELKRLSEGERRKLFGVS